MIFVSENLVRLKLRQLGARYGDKGDFSAEAVAVQICPVDHPEYFRVRGEVEAYLDSIEVRGLAIGHEDDIGVGSMKFYRSVEA